VIGARFKEREGKVMLVGFKAKNHPQQTRYAGSNRDVNDRSLPPEEFAKLDVRFNFTIDVAASKENTKKSRYFTVDNNGLFQPWAGERVYCNPPYSQIQPWTDKAWTETSAELIVMLLPANRTEQKWWQEDIEPYRDRPGSPLAVEFLAGRKRFLKPGQSCIGPNERPPFGVCLCIWIHNGFVRTPAGKLFS
jgi:phage N-6-adenine-methyltransferase